MNDKKYQQQMAEVEKHNQLEKELDAACENILIANNFEESFANVEELTKDSLTILLYENCNDIKTFKLGNNKAECYLFILQKTILHKMPKGAPYSTTDKYYYGLIKTKKHYPRILIRPETIEDKIAEFLNRREIDFSENRKFSSAFYVISDDEIKTKNIFTNLFLNSMLEFKTAHMEFYGNSCFFTHSLKPVSPLEAEKFCKMVVSILDHVI